MTLTPAYGRDYTSAKEAKSAFLANHDFVIADIFHRDTGRYCNLADLAGNEKHVTLRYAKLRKVTVVQVPAEYKP